MKNLYIVGAGGCGREVLQWVLDINKITVQWSVKGFLDENLNALNGKVCRYTILDKPSTYKIQADDVFVCAIGDGATRKKVVENLEARGAHFISVVHPTAVVADTAVLGKGTILYPFSLVSDNTRIGNGCIINMFSSVAHDVVMGDYCTVSAHCDITGQCMLGNNVFLGSGAGMVPGVTVGNNVFICAGSTVMSRVKDGIKVIGTPAKKAGF